MAGLAFRARAVLHAWTAGGGAAAPLPRVELARRCLAVMAIERAWLCARYDPSHAICRDVLRREYLQLVGTPADRPKNDAGRDPNDVIYRRNCISASSCQPAPGHIACANDVM